ncbi:putative glucose-1-phosphate cytidylyltransferase [Magnetofaba australis IT-1]|uniref:Putative glucose-1-phosphate cytidylyltransferase n=1 Tax=Magnetofaba australis IT-1 TaxID=1434232 RepID=A0A1Y2K2J7_9PROT|nr:putative glucose-1-phosphate cytidylyltransferase [Magnetofaba australis IT-1]
MILAGGLGTRLSEETHLIPKPMVRIGERPMLWHIMKLYSAFGVNDFIICLGYKGYAVKDFFKNYQHHVSDITYDFRTNETVVHQDRQEPWRVTLVETGLNTQTGGRIKAIGEYLEPGETFCMTYGDGLCNADIAAEIEFHKAHGKLATVLAVNPPGRFGVLGLREGDGDDVVDHLQEKPKRGGAWINGGFFVLNQKVVEYIDGPANSWEDVPLNRLANEGQLMAYRHDGYWQAMDTLREKHLLEQLWESGNAPWKLWK